MKENKKIPPKQTAENIPEVEHSEIPTSNEETISSEENILPEIEQSEIPPLSGTEIIETSNTATKNDMEVHHHAHDPAAPHHKKNWKSYFWEFLMLFLAVFCGFLAEYQLEHKIERDRGKQFIISFYEDLKYDTSYLTIVMNSYTKKTEQLKVLSLCYDSILTNENCKSCLTALYKYSQGFNELRSADRTIQQLKNAGGLRLLKSADADSIIAYDNLVRGYKIDETTTFQETQTDLRSISAELFNYAVVKDGNFSEGDLLITSDKILLNKYFNTLNRYAQYSIIYFNKLERIKSKATNIMIYFNQKYHID